jgi:Tol biopolymer transport system component
MKWGDTEPVWSPDGRKLAFVRERVDDHNLGGSGSLYTVDAAGVGTPTGLATKNTVDERSPAWSPDGRKIAYVGGKPSGEGGGIFVVSVKGGAATALATTKIVNDPTWSPDGDRIAYTAAPDVNTQTDIRTTGTRGGTPKRVTQTRETWEAEPTWSPNGQRIAYIYDAPNNQTYPHGIRAIAATGEGGAYRILPTADYPGIQSSDLDWGIAAVAPPS